MPRELSMAAPGAPVTVAPAMAPTTSATAVISFKSLLRLVTKHELEVLVIGLWVVWFILLQLQIILAPKRHCSRHPVVKYVAKAAYHLPTVIAFYTANLVQRAPASDVKFALSVGCSFLLVACARFEYTMATFTLDGDPGILESWRLWPYLLYFSWQLIWFEHGLTVSTIFGIILIFAGPTMCVLLAKPRPGLAILELETKEFADYMMQESMRSHLFSAGDDDVSSRLFRCRYPFMQLKDGEWIDFSCVLELEEPAVDPDICLSYSFCRLLARRYFGFPCIEDGDEEVREFVLTELLEDLNRGFTIVEVQLALLHDYFFTTYQTRLTSGLVSVWQGMVVAFEELMPLFVGSIIGYVIANRRYHYGSTLVSIVACVMLALLVHIVTMLPKYPVLPRYWLPIKTVFRHYSTDEASDSSSSPPVNERRPAPEEYWQNKMGQYSLLEDYDRRRSLMDTLLEWCKEHILSQASHSFVKHHLKEETDVLVPDSVKMFLVRTIKEMNCPPTIWTRSVVDDFSWTCRQKTLTDVILIWHVATCYCDMMAQAPEEDVHHQTLRRGSTSLSLEEPSTRYREIATTISKYCAYLVAILPELLPEHSLTVKVVFQQVSQQARDLLVETHMSMDKKRTRIQELQLLEDVSSLTTFQKGLQLGRQLEQQTDVSLRWKVMADFWSKMILYAASSDENAAAHIDHLAQGGEFLTHLWALLCNAGILKPATVEGHHNILGLACGEGGETSVSLEH